jgi:hypothetical protein
MFVGDPNQFAGWGATVSQESWMLVMTSLVQEVKRGILMKGAKSAAPPGRV